MDGGKSIQEQLEAIEGQLEAVVEAMCKDYCRYPREWDEADGDLWDSDVCANCPLNKLV